MGNETPTTSADDLINELRQETEQSQTIQFEEPEIQQAERDHEGDFEEVEEIKESTPKAAPEDITPGKAKGMAERWIKMGNSFMKMVFPWIYRSTILAKGDIEKMREFRQRYSGKNEKEIEDAIHSDHEMWPVTNRFDKYMKAVEDIPLDKDEIEMIADPLSELIVKYKNLQLGPEWMFLIAIGMVLTSRVAPMMPDMSKIFAENKKAA